MGEDSEPVGRSPRVMLLLLLIGWVIPAVVYPWCPIELGWWFELDPLYNRILRVSNAVDAHGVSVLRAQDSLFARALGGADDHDDVFYLLLQRGFVEKCEEAKHSPPRRAAEDNPVTAQHDVP